MAANSVSQAFKQYTRASDPTPGVIDGVEAQALIQLAEKANQQGGGCCGSGSSSGTKELAKLRQENPKAFVGFSGTQVDEWLRAQGANSSRSRGFFDRFRSGSSSSTPTTRPVDSTTSSSRIGSSDPVKGKLIMDWHASKSTWGCHWFPMQESNQPGGDAYNNLYAKGGALEKYDATFKGNARSYELSNNHFDFGANKDDYGWWGHCNYASQVACLLEEPKRAVTMNGVTFSPQDISGLLVKVVGHLTENVDFRGNRYNGPSEDPNDPSPHVFLNDICKPWGQTEKKPFILDVDPRAQVWNYPYDQGKIWESDKAPEGFNGASLGKVKYYTAELQGTGFTTQRDREGNITDQGEERNYHFWIKYADDGKTVLQSGWIDLSDDGKPNPDFAWIPRPFQGVNLRDKAAWTSKEGADTNNPQVRPEDVYQLYIRSI